MSGGRSPLDLDTKPQRRRQESLKPSENKWYQTCLLKDRPGAPLILSLPPLYFIPPNSCIQVHSWPRTRTTGAVARRDYKDEELHARCMLRFAQGNYEGALRIGTAAQRTLDKDEERTLRVAHGNLPGDLTARGIALRIGTACPWGDRRFHLVCGGHTSFATPRPPTLHIQLGIDGVQQEINACSGMYGWTVSSGWRPAPSTALEAFVSTTIHIAHTPVDAVSAPSAPFTVQFNALSLNNSAPRYNADGVNYFAVSLRSAPIVYATQFNPAPVIRLPSTSTQL
ncbi:hypothetical protein K438DRAFT_1971036 [Mycena galopus ATCC 62051]|nr:hypothetical protein K438DRAFT_1971036 [Mycena galopus ATCC 62051]